MGRGSVRPDHNVGFHGIMSVGVTVRTFELVRRIFMEFYQNLMLLVVVQACANVNYFNCI